MRVEIECPKCGTYLKVENDYDYHTCHICDSEFELEEED